MKKGDIVVYTNENLFSSITKGKQYEVIGSFVTSLGTMAIMIYDDNGDIHGIEMYRFKPLSEIREEKLNEIGI